MIKEYNFCTYGCHWCTVVIKDSMNLVVGEIKGLILNVRTRLIMMLTWGKIRSQFVAGNDGSTPALADRKYDL